MAKKITYFMIFTYTIKIVSLVDLFCHENKAPIKDIAKFHNHKHSNDSLDQFIEMNYVFCCVSTLKIVVFSKKQHWPKKHRIN